MRSTITFAAILFAVLFCCASVQAETTTEVRTGEVVAVSGNHLVIKMSTGETKEFEVPEGFTFNVDGKDVPVSELKPGTKLTRTITTTKEPKKVHTTEVKNGVVWHQQGNTVIITGSDGKNRRYDNVPDWIKFQNDGKEIGIHDLRKGMNVSATIVSESQSMVVSTTPGGVSGSAPAPPPAPAAAPAPAAEPAEEAPAELPKTAGNFGILLVAGLALLALSFKLR
jgi:hypothetical protein